MCICSDCIGLLRFFFSSRRRHTSCALVTGVQTCALPIWILVVVRAPAIDLELAHALRVGRRGEAFALVDLRVPGKGEFGHGVGKPGMKGMRGMGNGRLR